MVSSIIKYSDYPNLTVGQLNGKVYFSVTDKKLTKFIFLSSVIDFTFTDSSIKLTALNSEILSKFVEELNSLKFVGEELTFKKKLRLKGLGFRISVDMIKRELSLKLGYSHLISLDIPDYITNIKSKKNVMLLESLDKVALGDFFKKIYDLRKADAYKGKGFSAQYEKRKLKIIKKK
jgi:ribosomal protein L6P/L9E